MGLGWREVKEGLGPIEYAQEVCKALAWAYQGNLTLISECVTALAKAKGLDLWGGFVLLMEAIEYAQQRRVRVDRWFFQDGKYNWILRDISEAGTPAMVKSKKGNAKPQAVISQRRGKMA